MKDFRDLQVWQKAHLVTLDIYQSTQSFPSDERYGLTSQLRRSSASVAANIAEGCGRGSDSDFRRFLQMAMGSASEAEYHLLLAKDLHLIADEPYQTLTKQIQEIKRMLASLIKKLIADG
ncbi:MAG: four helix bundle protein [Pirellulales bacterium]|nr:four helix bundle protein [Pirellulales bacterium]